MPDKKLPPPPAHVSAFANALAGIRDWWNSTPDINPQDLWSKPVAQSRITRTPIYQTTGMDWPASQDGEYTSGFNPNSQKHIEVRPGALQEDGAFIIPHESTHAIFDKAGLAPSATSLLNSSTGPGLGLRASQMISGNPDLYPPMPELPEGQFTDRTVVNAHLQRMANEGLAYSVGTPEGTPYVEHVASRISDPALAQQLLRLHRNALAVRHPTVAK